MNNKIFISAIVFSFVCLTTPVSTIARVRVQDTDAVERTIRYCVEVVHKYPVNNEINAPFFQEFDAYYNPANGRIIDSGYRVGDRAPRFQFHKCLTAQGITLTPVRE